jgi:hypothetical protein
VFIRITSALGGSDASRDRVGGTGTGLNGSRKTRFSGRTLVLTTAERGGFARETTIEFSENFTTCDAHVVVARQAGSDVVLVTSLHTGPSFEVRSATVIGSATCSIREGNVFAQ